MTNTETKLISINAALAERAERLRAIETSRPSDAGHPLDVWSAIGQGLNEASALKSQIRDLETEKHALLQELPL